MPERINQSMQPASSMRRGLRAGALSGSRLYLAILGVSGLLLVLLLAGGSAPAACASCHAMRPYAQSLSDSSHSSVACYSCHLDSGAWGWLQFKTHELFVMYPAALRGADVSGPVTEVNSGACLGCHAAVKDAVIEAGGIRIDHQSCAPGSTCDTCHSAVAHGPVTRWVREPVMEVCIECHRANKASTGCDDCHADKSQKERLSRGPWQITHGPQWQLTHGMGSLRFCDTCHPDDYCIKCHGVELPHSAGFGRTHGASAQAPGAQCLDCHDRVQLCDECHGVPMPHPDDFLPTHSAAASSSAGEDACRTCHRDEDCVACHTKHVHPGNTDGTLGDPETGAIRGLGGGSQ